MKDQIADALLRKYVKDYQNALDFAEDMNNKALLLALELTKADANEESVRSAFIWLRLFPKTPVSEILKNSLE
jgi:hypothetical protein